MVQHLNLLEYDYFGLEHIVPNQKWEYWIEAEKPILKQVRYGRDILLSTVIQNLQNRDVSGNGPLACLLVCSLAPLTCSLGPAHLLPSS